MRKMLRHGDVTLIPIDAIPQEAKLLKGKKTLAEGEKTNHKHVIDVGQLFESKDGKLYLKSEKMTNLTHEEHRKSPIPKGNYLVVIKRQYSPDGGWSNVLD